MLSLRWLQLRILFNVMSETVLVWERLMMMTWGHDCGGSVDLEMFEDIDAGEGWMMP